MTSARALVTPLFLASASGRGLVRSVWIIAFPKSQLRRARPDVYRAAISIMYACLNNPRMC